MAMEILYKGGEGVKVILNVEVDITASTVWKVRYRKPRGGTGFWTAVKESNTSISYTTQSGDFNYVGTWRLQAYVECGWKLYGKIVKVKVVNFNG